MWVIFARKPFSLFFCGISGDERELNKYFIHLLTNKKLIFSFIHSRSDERFRIFLDSFYTFKNLYLSRWWFSDTQHTRYIGCISMEFCSEINQNTIPFFELSLKFGIMKGTSIRTTGNNRWIRFCHMIRPKYRGNQCFNLIFIHPWMKIMKYHMICLLCYRDCSSHIDDLCFCFYHSQWIKKCGHIKKWKTIRWKNLQIWIICGLWCYKSMNTIHLELKIRHELITRMNRVNSWYHRDLFMCHSLGSPELLMWSEWVWKYFPMTDSIRFHARQNTIRTFYFSQEKHMWLLAKWIIDIPIPPMQSISG